MEQNYPKLNELQYNLTYEQYAAFDGLRSSDLKLLKRSPAHWRHRSISNDAVPSDALEFGRNFHTAIQNPERFMDLIKIEPEFKGYTKDGRISTRSAEAKRFREEWRSSLPKDAIVVSAQDADVIAGMLKSCSTHSLVKNLLKKGITETSLWVQDAETGEILKCRPDYISAYGHMVDIKTTRDASHPFFYNQIYRSEHNGDPYYAMQAAHYTHCAKQAQTSINGNRVRGDVFYFVAIEKDPPYAIMTWSLDESSMDPAEQWRAQLTRTYAKCKKEGTWPAYPEAAIACCVPRWAELPDTEIWT